MSSFEQPGHSDDLNTPSARRSVAKRPMPTNADMDETEDSNNVQVCVRIRPNSMKEKESNVPNSISAPSNSEIKVRKKSSNGAAIPDKMYTFDHVFNTHSTQEDVFRTAIDPLVEEVLNGFNCTVFAYGQTGTGKTHTMEGSLSSNAEEREAGVIPRTVHTIFQRLAEYSEFSVKVSFLELYNEELSDLLTDDSERQLRIYEDATGRAGMLVSGLEEVIVARPEQVFDLLRKSQLKRRVAETNMNAKSSRSHYVFTITIHTREAGIDGDDVIKTGKLHLVDLAGSECVGKSGAQNQRAKEAGKINQSLLTLGRVINALVEKQPYVPYRDSKLTRLLQESLGGRSKTCIIATVSPSHLWTEESLSTLEYANRAKNITNKPQVNQKLSKKTYMKDLVLQIAKLKEENMSLRMKNGVFMPPDQYEELTEGYKSKCDQLQEAESTLENKEKELDEIRTLCNMTKGELEVLTEKYSVTEMKLEVTKEMLTETKVNLVQTYGQLDEARHIVKQQHKTETQLAEETRVVKEALVEMVDEKYRLHDKIDRKRSVEEDNKDLLRQFVSGLHTNVVSLRDEAVVYSNTNRGELEKMNQSLVRNHEEHASTSMQLQETMQEQMKAMQGKLRHLQNSTHTTLNMLSDRVGTDSKCSREDVSTMQRGHEERIKENATMRQAEHQLVTGMVASTSTHIQASMEQVQALEQGQVTHMNTLKQGTSEFMQHQEAQNKQFHNVIAQHQQEYATMHQQGLQGMAQYVQDRSSKMNSFHKTVDTKNEEVTMNLNTHCQSITNAIVHYADASAQYHMERKEQNDTDMHCFSEEMEAQCNNLDSAEETSLRHINQMQEHLQDMHIFQRDANDQLQTQLQNTNKVIIKQNAVLEKKEADFRQEYTQMHIAGEARVDTLQKQMQQFESTLLQNLHTQTSAFMTQMQQMMTSFVSSQCQFVSSSIAQLEQQVTEHKNMVNHEYQQNMSKSEQLEAYRKEHDLNVTSKLTQSIAQNVQDMQQHVQMVDTLTCDMTTHKTSLTKNIKTMLTHVNDQYDRVVTSANSVSEHADKFEAVTGNATDMMKTMESSTNKQQLQMMQAYRNSIQSYTAEEHSEHTQIGKSMSLNAETKQQTMLASYTVTNEYLGCNGKNMVNYETCMVSSMDENMHNVHSHISNMIDTDQNMITNNDTIHKAYISTQQDYQGKEMDYYTQSSASRQKLTQALAANEKNAVNIMDQCVVTAEANMDVISKHLDDSYVSSTQTVDAMQKMVTDHSHLIVHKHRELDAYTQQYLQMHVHKIETIEHATQAIVQDYREDVPLGTTPLRRNVVIPNHFTRTRQLERIAKDFKSARAQKLEYTVDESNVGYTLDLVHIDDVNGQLKHDVMLPLVFEELEDEDVMMNQANLDITQPMMHNMQNINTENEMNDTMNATVVMDQEALFQMHEDVSATTRSARNSLESTASTTMFSQMSQNNENEIPAVPAPVAMSMAAPTMSVTRKTTTTRPITAKRPLSTTNAGSTAQPTPVVRTRLSK